MLTYFMQDAEVDLRQHGGDHDADQNAQHPLTDVELTKRACRSYDSFGRRLAGDQTSRTAALLRP